ncbi:hypothetical protein HDV05_007390 [Chytridiales sp. JEL 0842]|nr:hypothetical protein HDV05_007390 [Chytridiales sp. JEL 0842]
MQIQNIMESDQPNPDSLPSQTSVQIRFESDDDFENDEGDDDPKENPNLDEMEMGKSSSGGDVDNADFLEHRSLTQVMKSVVFATLFFMTHGNKSAKAFEYLMMIIEDLQLFAFFLTFEMSAIYALPPALSTVVNMDYGVMDISHYQIINLLAAITIFILVINITVVATGSMFGNQKFFDSNPTRKGPRNKSNGRLDMGYLILKTIMILVYEFLGSNSYLIKTAVVTLSCLFMFGLTLFYLPYFNLNINQMRAGFYFSAFLVGMTSFFSGVAFSSTGVQRGYETLGCIVALMVLGFIAGFKACGMMYRWIQTSVERKFTLWESQDHSEDNENEILVFHLWPHVEIAARKLTEKMDDRHRRFNKTKAAELKRIFIKGIQEFPEQPFLRMFYAMYLHHLEISAYDAARQVSRVKSSNPVLDIEYLVYYATRISSQTKDADFLGLDVKLDPTAYAEFQKLDRNAKLNHFLAVQEIRNMWKLTLDKHFKLEDISHIANRLYNHAEKAQDAYAALAAKFPRSKPIMRFYARFCFDVTNDIVLGEQLTHLADDLENLNSSADDIGALERFAFERNRTSAGGSPSMPRGSNSQRQRRLSVSIVEESKPSKGSHDGSSVGRSETSQGTQRRRELLSSQRLRDAKFTQRGYLFTILIILKAVSIISLAIANYAVVSNLLSDEGFALSRISWYNDRSFYTALSFRRVRQLQAATSSTEFNQIKSRLMEETTNFTKASHQLFLTRIENDPDINYFDTAPIITSQISNYPLENGTRPMNVSLFQFTKGFVSSAFQIANMTMESFNNSQFNNNVRYILDNYDTAQRPYRTALQQLYLPFEWAQSQRAKIVVFVLTGIILAVKYAMVLGVDISLLRFEMQQVRSLEVFRSIPTEVIKSSLEDLNDADSSDVFPQEIIKSADTRGRNDKPISRRIILKSLLYLTVCMKTILALSFALSNVNTMDALHQDYGHINQAADLRENAVRAYNLAYDLRRYDPLTWGTPTTLVRSYSNSVQSLVTGIRSVLFGDATRTPATLSYNRYAKDVINLLNVEPCLAFNASLCNGQVRAFNDTIGYNYNSISLGLLHLTNQIIPTHLDLLAAAAAGIRPDPGRLEFLDNTLEPDLLDGWEQVKIRLQNSMKNITSYQELVNRIILIIQVVLVSSANVVQYLFVCKIMSNYRFTEHCIYGILNKLPVHVKRIPAIEAALKTGGL